MEITRKEYQAAKRLVHAFEEQERIKANERRAKQTGESVPVGDLLRNGVLMSEGYMSACGDLIVPY